MTIEMILATLIMFIPLNIFITTGTGLAIVIHSKGQYAKEKLSYYIPFLGPSEMIYDYQESK